LKQEQKETTNQAKSFGFFKYQTENRKKRTKTRKLMRQTKKNNENIFGLFVFWKVEIREQQRK
jgi:hypothetical protein